MERIPLTELTRLPFVDHSPSDGRRVILAPYYEPNHRDWHLYIRTDAESLGRMAGGEPVYGGYFGKVAADAGRDIELPLATLVTQHLSFPKVYGRLQGLENDIHQFAAIMEKYHRICAISAEPHISPGLLAASELEYLLLLLRSMYDLLQGIVAAIAGLFVALDDRSRRIVKELPDSFRDVVMKGDELRSGDQIVEKYRLPPQLANWYVAEAPAFREVRRLRDSIAHHGRTVPTIFELQEGLGLIVSDPIWSDYAVWPREARVDDKFGSVRALFAGLMLTGIGATARFADAIESCIQLPEAIGDGIRSYLRSPFGHWLIDLPNILADPWEHVRPGSGEAATNNVH